MSELPTRVLTIQSHVAFGYVGGKAAVFPLQCLGYDVDVVNTVNFSNHSGYGRFAGSRATAADLETIFSTMEKNRLLKGGRLLTGYVPGAEALSSVKDLAARLRERNPDLVYLLDPVLGDSGKLYVAPDCIPVYKTMLPLSTIITPNWFEVEVLTGVQLKDLVSMQQALRILHTEHHVPNVVISSIPYRPWLRQYLPVPLRTPEDHAYDDFLLCICSAQHPNAQDKGMATSEVHAQCVPLIPGYFSGVGDLFSALVLAHFSAPSPSPHPPTLASASSSTSDASPISGAAAPLPRATARALAKTHAVLMRTQAYYIALPADEQVPTDEELDAADPERRVTRMRARELRLVQSQDILRDDSAGEAMVKWVGFWGL